MIKFRGYFCFRAFNSVHGNDGWVARMNGFKVMFGVMVIVKY